MNGRGIQTLIEAILVILDEIITWAVHRKGGKSGKDHAA